MMKKIILVMLSLVVVSLFLVGCIKQAEETVEVVDEEGNLAGEAYYIQVKQKPYLAKYKIWSIKYCLDGFNYRQSPVCQSIGQFHGYDGEHTYLCEAPQPPTLPSNVCPQTTILISSSSYSYQCFGSSQPFNFPGCIDKYKLVADFSQSPAPESSSYLVECDYNPTPADTSRACGSMGTFIIDTAIGYCCGLP